MASRDGQEDAEAVVGLREVRCPRDRLLELLERAACIACQRQRSAKLVSERRVIGRPLEASSKMLGGRLEVTTVHRTNSTILFGNGALKQTA